ncbi:hypothetical protein SERLADRAFT_457539 [Serpula lacrymans var. lacrymans S7.9]|uniref:Uncharacterized protein n=1 Tax=Serpula lacrymans var. lacrymans (strain S7.9) TaxID=578457 RepID=F8NJA5_SERL9|nr:uncharacterized protein SERLADRAFT_457539 [Serpula lacrymans var. lacrymans S7.9]EGO29589.1 hypothetical protein SERLADRAFT_457539 [Serpula lacrymans var. lacrymans S7.9]
MVYDRILHFISQLHLTVTIVWYSNHPYPPVSEDGLDAKIKGFLPLLFSVAGLVHRSHYLLKRTVDV